MSFFYAHNEQKIARHSGAKTPVPPVEHYYDAENVSHPSSDHPSEYFGFPFDQDYTNSALPTTLSSLTSFPEEPSSLLELNRKLDDMLVQRRILFQVQKNLMQKM